LLALERGRRTMSALNEGGAGEDCTALALADPI
jgi:hypothetical protein